MCNHLGCPWGIHPCCARTSVAEQPGSPLAGSTSSLPIQRGSLRQPSVQCSLMSSAVRRRGSSPADALGANGSTDRPGAESDQCETVTETAGRSQFTPSKQDPPRQPSRTVSACNILKMVAWELPMMATRIAQAATVLAVLLAVTAFVTLSMERQVLSGTLFVLTAFAIYIRETYK